MIDERKEQLLIFLDELDLHFKGDYRKEAMIESLRHCVKRAV